MRSASHQQHAEALLAHHQVAHQNDMAYPASTQVQTHPLIYGAAFPGADLKEISEDNLSMQAQPDYSPPRFDFRHMQMQIDAQQRQHLRSKLAVSENSSEQH